MNFYKNNSTCDKETILIEKSKDDAHDFLKVLNSIFGKDQNKILNNLSSNLQIITDVKQICKDGEDYFIYEKKFDSGSTAQLTFSYYKTNNRVVRYIDNGYQN